VASSVTDFNYKIPDEENFLRAVLINLKQKGRNDIISLLDGCKCTISMGSSFSGKRWDAFWTTVGFEVPMNKYQTVVDSMTEEINQTIKSVCNEVMPLKSGLDVMEVTFSMSLEGVSKGRNLMTDLEKITKELPPELKSEIIPEDIKDKAKQMSEVYTYLYCVENSLRGFVAKISKENYGEDYLSKLKLNTDMKRKIQNRKKSKEKIKWLSVRGDSDIFYLDFDDIGAIIRNNWDIFRQYFESLEWIVTNINEIAECRNPIAHHCYLEEHERDVVRVNFAKIMKQISEAFK
jgi:hypothetical protein